MSKKFSKFNDWKGERKPKVLEPKDPKNPEIPKPKSVELVKKTKNERKRLRDDYFDPKSAHTIPKSEIKEEE